MEENPKLIIEQRASSFVDSKYIESRDARKTTECIWLDSFRAHRGLHSPEASGRIKAMKEKNPAASTIFVKITKTKVQAAYGQMLEVLFAGNKFPIGVEPTPIPEGVADKVRIVDQSTTALNSDTDVYGYEGDGRVVAPGETHQSLLNGLYDRLKGVIGNKQVEEGPALDPSHIQLHPAEEDAKELEKQMHDQLAESDAEFGLRRTVFEQCLYGSGIYKGPMNYNKVQHKFEQSQANGPIEYTPQVKRVPKFNHVSCWNFYPDPQAARLEDAEYVIERHIMSKNKIRDLVNMPFFDKEALIDILNEEEPTYAREYWEDNLTDTAGDKGKHRYQVLEYWGYLDKQLAKDLEIDFDEANVLDSVQVNIWTCNGRVLRAVANPFTPSRIPYCLAPYEEQPHQLWGIGIPENMSDTQAIINGHMRMAIDNLRYSGNMIFEINRNFLAPGQDLTMYPGKVIEMQAGAPGQSIHGITFPNTAPSNIQMMDKAMQLADQQTGIPSFSHGQTGVSGVGRTASGISMLMSAAALNIKTVIRNLDHYLLRPLGKSLFYWNMQFNSENIRIRGDMDIVARGTSSLMQKEVRTQRLLSFLQIAGQDPMTNRKYILAEIAESMDLDKEKVINSNEEAILYASLLQGNQNVTAQQGISQGPDGTNGQQGIGSPQQAMGTPEGSGITGNGNGNIGTGAVQNPGEDSFSGNA